MAVFMAIFALSFVFILLTHKYHTFLTKRFTSVYATRKVTAMQADEILRYKHSNVPDCTIAGNPANKSTRGGSLLMLETRAE